MYRNHAHLRFALLALPLLALGACQRQDRLNVGVVLPLTGTTAVYGESVQKGLEVAAAELQQAHDAGAAPYPLELSIVDSQGAPERAAALARELFDGGATAIIGGISDAEAQAMAPVAIGEHRVLLSPTAATPPEAGTSRYYYRLFPSGERESMRIASFVTRELALTRVVLASSENASEGAGRAFLEEVERQGGEVVAEVRFEPESDVGEVVGEILAPRPQAVFVVGAAEEVQELLEELRRRRYRGAVLTTSAFSAPQVLQAAARSAEGVYVSRTVFDVGSEDPAVQRFVTAFRERHGEDPDLFAAYGYDALRVLAAAAQEAGLSPRQLWTGVRGIQDLRGATGHIQFDERGGVPSFPRIYVVRSGRLAMVGAKEQERAGRFAAFRPRVTPG
jgi:branched-chain amino acid transport system substrate-binding protein